MLQKTITPHLVRQFIEGAVNMSTLPAALIGELQAIRRRYIRQMMREQRREAKAQQYRAAALAGGGKREVARRTRQLAAA